MVVRVEYFRYKGRIYKTRGGLIRALLKDNSMAEGVVQDDYNGMWYWVRGPARLVAPVQSCSTSIKEV